MQAVDLLCAAKVYTLKINNEDATRSYNPKTRWLSRYIGKIIRTGASFGKRPTGFEDLLLVNLNFRFADRL